MRSSDLRQSGSRSGRWLDGVAAEADDATVLEYATVIAVLGTLSTSLSGLQAQLALRLSGSDAVAVQLAVRTARASGLPPAAARATYAHAPYKRPALRYVYANGWTAGSKHLTSCALAQLDVSGTRDLALKAIRANASTVAQLRRLHLTAAQAATAFANGFLSAC